MEAARCFIHECEYSDCIIYTKCSNRPVSISENTLFVAGKAISLIKQHADARKQWDYNDLIEHDKFAWLHKVSTP
jgi:hypothetical protein